MIKNSSIQVCPLASGSKGNSLFISMGNHGILVDAGLSGVEIQRRLESVGISTDALSAIVITHEHSDHTRGAGVLSRRFNLPLYISEKTYTACSGLGKISQLEFFECGMAFDIGEVRVSPFAISHDASDPAGLTLEFEDHKVGVATDLGIVTNLVKYHLSDSSVLVLESNHDPEMLMNGPYPWHLKDRIKGRKGHLSNQDAADLINELKTDRLKYVILAHLSEENNCPQKAAETVAVPLNGSDVCLHVAGPEKAGDLIVL